MIVVGGWPGRNVVGLNGAFGVRPAAFATGGDFANPLDNDVDAGDTTTEFVAVVTALPGSGTVTFNDDGGFNHVGAADGTYTTTFNLFTWAQGGPLTAHATPETVTTTIGTVLPTVNANAAVTLSNFTFSAQAVVAVTAQSAVTLSPFTFAATAAAVVAASSVVTLDAFTFSAEASVTGEGVESFSAYATAALFVAKYGLTETTQYLADEQRLMTETLLQDAMRGTWTGTPSTAEKAAARAGLSRLNRQLATTSRLMDGYLRTVVALPLPTGNENASTLEDCCLALARGGLADDCDNYTEQIERSCEHWTKWLKDIAARRVQLLQPSGEAVPTRGGVRSGRAKSGFDWGGR